MEKKAFRQLFEKYLGDKMSPEEVDQWFSTIQDDGEEEQWIQSIEALLRNKPMHGLADPDRMKAVLQAILTEKTDAEPAQVIKMNTRSGKRLWGWIAAATIIVILSGSAILWFNRTSKPVMVTAGDQRHQFKNDRTPGGNKAMLTLANGSVIVLDSAQNGTLAEQGNMKVLKLDDGMLKYEGAASNNETAYNTLSTPRGGQYKLILPDGSKVWLNAASSITYPTAFTGTERKVSIVGEAYFEVTKNAARPFKVSVDGMEIAVLGTHFNVNAYSDESTIKTTLLEGAVRITKGNANGLLKPGQQAQLNHSGATISILNNIDLDEVMAWKNGAFNFNDQNLAQVMRKLSRWYDIDVIYENGIPDIEFGGKMSSNLNLSDVLGFLRGSKVKFRIEGKRLIVMQTKTGSVGSTPGHVGRRNLQKQTIRLPASFR
jgi:ferric-dicitrate binding protein FerR (iron transport regulator)